MLEVMSLGVQMAMAVFSPMRSPKLMGSRLWSVAFLAGDEEFDERTGEETLTATRADSVTLTAGRAGSVTLTAGGPEGPEDVKFLAGGADPGEVKLRLGEPVEIGDVKLRGAGTRIVTTGVYVLVTIETTSVYDVIVLIVAGAEVV